MLIHKLTLGILMMMYSDGLAQSTAPTLLSNRLNPQNRYQVIPQKSDAQAIELVQRAISALGGETAWSRTQAATANVSVQSDSIPTYNIVWTDDWSQPRFKFRRDTNNLSHVGTLIENGNIQRHIQDGRDAKHVLRKDSDIAVLAIGYPAEALLRSMSDDGCTFTMTPFDPNKNNQDQEKLKIFSVTEHCKISPTRYQQVTIIWQFYPDTSIPMSAEIPVWGQLRQIEKRETVKYKNYSLINNCLVPSQIDMVRYVGLVDHLSISNTTFRAGFSENDF